jgi:hypothetical protein
LRMMTEVPAQKFLRPIMQADRLINIDPKDYQLTQFAFQNLANLQIQ